MSADELKELKRATKKYIDRADELVVRKVYALLKKNTDWWDAMPGTVRKDVEESLGQADRGEVMTQEQVKKKYPQWFLK